MLEFGNIGVGTQHTDNPAISVGQWHLTGQQPGNLAVDHAYRLLEIQFCLTG